jgi:hypothetical protein
MIRDAALVKIHTGNIYTIYYTTRRSRQNTRRQYLQEKLYGTPFSSKYALVKVSHYTARRSR